ncbi:MAG: ferrochelatase [Gemmatimonadaceae bacterium]|nr:ferrochelatase [Gemmatimonadaceae bacterium]
MTQNGQDMDAILVMAYGSPQRPEDVEPYYTHIRRGRAPSPEQLTDLLARYARVGGVTPLHRHTDAVVDRLREMLAAEGTPLPVYVGMKHWHPFVKEAVQRMSDDGIRHAHAIVLAPHYSRLSIGEYRKYLDEAIATLAEPMTVDLVESWHRQPEFIAMMADLVRGGLEKFAPDEQSDVRVVFSAHSLPMRIRTWGDPYESELRASARVVAEQVGLAQWDWAWQSAGATGEPWLGPDILDFLKELADQGVKRVLQVPIGFVSEHLEVLFDIDLEARQRAAELGMRLERSELPNARPGFITAVRAALRDQPVNAAVQSSIAR